jgi:hypothetical protein
LKTEGPGYQDRKRVPVKDCYDGYMKSMDDQYIEYILKNDVLRKIYEENQDT